MKRRYLMTLLAILMSIPARVLAQADPLPSWNEGKTKRAIVALVGRVTREGGPDFVPVAERVATFDNDGTLWCEQPMYVQAFFIRDRIGAGGTASRVARHPAVQGDPGRRSKALAGLGEKGLVELVTATHAGMTPTTSSPRPRLDRDGPDPRFGRPYTQCVYQPMLELLAYLRKNGFKTYIVSGGGVDFMRAWTEPVYGIPPEQVVGSTIKLAYELRDGEPVLMRLPEVEFVDDQAGKPVGIHEFIGRRPIAAFGNSDGDYEMLRYAPPGPGRASG